VERIKEREKSIKWGLFCFW